MVTNSFAAVMTNKEFLIGEIQHIREQEIRKLAMKAGLTKSSDELAHDWENNPKAYLMSLNGAITAYERNKALEELLIACIARLASMVSDESNEAVDLAMQIIKSSSSTYND